jgi:hypothetical protein
VASTPAGTEILELPLDPLPEQPARATPIAADTETRIAFIPGLPTPLASRVSG